jgi:hypothetical protein
VNKILRAFYNLSNILINSHFLFFIGDIRLKQNDVQNRLFSLNIKKYTIDATERSPYPEEIVNLIPRPSFTNFCFNNPV